MINIYDHRKTFIFCLEPRETGKKCLETVLKFSKNLVLKFLFFLLAALVTIETEKFS